MFSHQLDALRQVQSPPQARFKSDFGVSRRVSRKSGAARFLTRQSGADGLASRCAGLIEEEVQRAAVNGQRVQDSILQAAERR